MKINIKLLLISAVVSVSCLFSAAFAAEKGSAAVFDITENANPAGGRIIMFRLRQSLKTAAMTPYMF